MPNITTRNTTKKSARTATVTREPLAKLLARPEATVTQLTPKTTTPARRRMSPDDRVKILAEGNPHRPGTKDHAKFRKLTDGATVAEIRAAGIDAGYLREVARRGIIEIG